MAKKAKHPEHENLERWLVSYADFMTLLFATFTALYALSQTDMAKLKGVSDAIREGFEEESIMSGIKSVLQGNNPPSRNPDPLSSDKGAGPGVIGKFDSLTYQPGEIKSKQKLAKELAHDMEAMNRDVQAASKALSQGGKSTGTGEDPSIPIHPVEAAIQERGIRISFDSRLLFEPGNATLKPMGWKFLDTVAERLKQFGQDRIHVEGHTDSQAISTLIFPSNWELSAARASSVVRYFIARHQFAPSSLVAVGYAATQPIATNDTPEGRSRNRRVDIILYTDKLSGQLNPRLQYATDTPIATKSDTPDKPQDALPVLPAHSAEPGRYADGPVKVIIKEKDGTERVLIPKTKADMPVKSESGKPELVVSKEQPGKTPEKTPSHPHEATSKH